MINFKQYKVRIKHDAGYFYIIVSATSKETAKKLICTVEHCPDCAIKSIKRVTNIKTIKYYAKQFDNTYRYMGYKKYKLFKEHYLELKSWILSGNKIVINNITYDNVESLEQLGSK